MGGVSPSPRPQATESGTSAEGRVPMWVGLWAGLRTREQIWSDYSEARVTYGIVPLIWVGLWVGLLHFLSWPLSTLANSSMHDIVGRNNREVVGEKKQQVLSWELNAESSEAEEQ